MVSLLDFQMSDIDDETPDFFPKVLELKDGTYHFLRIDTSGEKPVGIYKAVAKKGYVAVDGRGEFVDGC